MATLRRCLELLTPDGSLLIQTPKFEKIGYEALVKPKGRILGSAEANHEKHVILRENCRFETDIFCTKPEELCYRTFAEEIKMFIRARFMLILRKKLNRR